VRSVRSDGESREGGEKNMSESVSLNGWHLRVISATFHRLQRCESRFDLRWKLHTETQLLLKKRVSAGPPLVRLQRF
jgi:hypothetical protein